MDGFRLQRDKMPEIRDFLLVVIGLGESGKIILQVSIADFRGHSKYFSDKDGSAPYKNWQIRLWVNVKISVRANSNPNPNSTPFYTALAPQPSPAFQTDPPHHVRYSWKLCEQTVCIIIPQRQLTLRVDKHNDISYNMSLIAVDVTCCENQRLLSTFIAADVNNVQRTPEVKAYKIRNFNFALY